MLNWAVRHRIIIVLGCFVLFIGSLFFMGGISTEFFPSQDNARIGVTLELPIGTKKEIAQQLSSELADKWLNDKNYHVKICNYTVGQADEDNTFASMQDNGSHIISFNISLVDPGDRDITQDEICEMMRKI